MAKKTKMYDTPHVECIDWRDARGMSGWVDYTQEWMEYHQEPAVCRSIGYVAAEGPGGIVLTTTLSPSGNDAAIIGTLTIPKVCIVKRKRIKALEGLPKTAY